MDKAYTADILFNPTADNVKGIPITNGGKLSLYGDPTIYGNSDNTTLAANWSAGQTFTIAGDYTTKWIVGQEVYVHKGAYSSYLTDVQKYTIATIVLNGSNTDITINEAAPGVLFKSGAPVMNPTRNIRIGKVGASTAVGTYNGNRPRMYNNNLTWGNTNVNVSNVLFTGLYGIELGVSGTYNNICCRNSENATVNLSQGQSKGSTVSGLFIYCAKGVNSANAMTFSGLICGSYRSGIVGGTYANISGKIFGCDRAITSKATLGPLSNLEIFANSTALLSTIVTLDESCKLGWTDAVSMPNVTDIQWEDAWGSLTQVRLRGTKLPSGGLIQGNKGLKGQQGFYVISEHHNQTKDAHYAYHGQGDVIKNDSVIRSGGGVSAVECIPNSICATDAPLIPFEWVETDVLASPQTRSIFLKGGGWSSWPTNTELYLEAEYISNATTLSRSKAVSTAVLTDNVTWIEFPVTFTPATVGDVVYRVYLKKYQAASKIYIDTMLNRQSMDSKKASWVKGESTLVTDQTVGGKYDKFAKRGIRRIYG